MSTEMLWFLDYVFIPMMCNRQERYFNSRVIVIVTLIV